MRTVVIVALCLMVGCSRPRPAPADIDGPAPAPAPEAKGLYTDAEIRKLASFDIDKEAGPDKGIFDVPILDVVPSGESRPRGEVFKALGLKDARVRGLRKEGRDFVVFLTWQVSPSYDANCMRAVNDRENNGLEMTDPKRKVYGIRLVRRGE